jgi:hypothetical protein
MKNIIHILDRGEAIFLFREVGWNGFNPLVFNDQGALVNGHANIRILFQELLDDMGPDKTRSTRDQNFFALIEHADSLPLLKILPDVAERSS